MIYSSTPLKNRLAKILPVGLTLLLCLPAAQADTFSWNGGNGSWGTGTSWTQTPTDTEAVPGIGDSAIFNVTGVNGAAVINLGAPQSANSITFQQTGATTLQGGGSNQTLTIGTGGITKSGSGAATIGAGANENVAVILGGSQTWTNSSSSALTINNGITGAAGSQTLTMDVASGGITIFGGIADGSGGAVSLIKNGASALSLRSTSSYTGTTTLNAGSINSGGSTTDVSNPTGTGQLIINGGSISNNASSNSPNFSLGNTSQTWGGDFSLSTGSSLTLRMNLGAASSNPITLTGNRIVSTSGNSLNSSININGTIGDGGNAYSMTWAGNGNVRVNLGAALSTYTGTTTILSSMIQFGANVASGANSAFGNSTSAILLGNTSGNVAAGILANANTFSFGRDITLQSGGTGTIIIGGVASSGTGGASMNNTGTITLGTENGSGRSVILHRGTFSGNIVDPSGLSGAPGVVTITSIRATNGNAENSFSTVLSGNNTFTGGVNLTNDSNGNNNTATLVMNSSTAIGTGTLTIGSTVGNLAIDSTAVGGTVLTTNNAQVWNGNSTGAFTFTGTQNLDMGTGAVDLGTATGTTRTVTTTANTLSVGGVISNGTTAVNLTKAGNGTLVLYGNSTYSGVTTISAGTLSIGRGGSTGSLASSSVVNNGTLVFNRSDNALVFSAPISGTGGVTQAGSGRTTLTGSNSYTGATTINAGTFIVNGSLAAGSAVALNNATLGGSGTIAGLVTTAGTGSILAPGNSPGTLNLTGGLNASLGATFGLELGTTSDLLNLGSGVFTGSTADDGLVFNFSDAGGLLAGNPYTLLQFGSASGLEYSDLFAMTTPSGFVLDTSFGTDGFLINGTSLQVQFSAIPEPSVCLLLISSMVAFGLMRSRAKSRCLV